MARSDMRYGVGSIVKACCGLLIAFSTSSGCVGHLADKPPGEASTLTREQRLKTAGEAAFKGRCETAWALLWPLARDGDGEALAHLASELYSSGLELPDTDAETGPTQKQFANALTLAIYGATASMYPSQGNLRFLLDAVRERETIVVASAGSGSISYRPVKAPSAASMTKLQSCFAAAASPAAGRACAGRAVELGLVPGFSEYRTAVDEILARNRPKGCYFAAY